MASNRAHLRVRFEALFRVLRGPPAARTQSPAAASLLIPAPAPNTSDDLVIGTSGDREIENRLDRRNRASSTASRDRSPGSGRQNLLTAKAEGANRVTRHARRAPGTPIRRPQIGSDPSASLRISPSGLNAVKSAQDPSTSLRISPSGSDALKSAQLPAPD